MRREAGILYKISKINKIEKDFLYMIFLKRAYFINC